MPMARLVCTVTTTVTATVVLVSYALWMALSPYRKRKRLRQKLPADLRTWRLPAGQKTTSKHEQQIWLDLDEVLRNEGYLQCGFCYAIPSRTVPDYIGNVGSLRQFEYSNPLTWVARTRDGRDVTIRVVAIGNKGQTHLKILRKLATGENSLFSNNHTLPLLAEFQFENISFCVFPKSGEPCAYAYDCWAKNSVEDIIDMVMQMLEALAFIHDLKIAHRDAFHDNFLVQWYPESLLTMKISPSRPRVYLIDFEVAIECPQDCPADECLVLGYPFGDSVRAVETYARPHAPELTTRNSYNPFKLDIWQLGTSISNFKSTISQIDEVLDAMADTDPTSRLGAKEALGRLQTVVHSMAPESLLIEPVVVGAD